MTDNALPFFEMEISAGLLRNGCPLDPTPLHLHPLTLPCDCTTNSHILRLLGSKEKINTHTHTHLPPMLMCVSIIRPVTTVSVVACIMMMILPSNIALHHRCLVAAFSSVKHTQNVGRRIQSSSITTIHALDSTMSQPQRTMTMTLFSSRVNSALWTTTSAFRKQSLSKMSMSATSLEAVTNSNIIPRVKAADATKPTDGNPVLIKGWVRTVRKQKTLAFVEVNDGSNLGGIQCVLSFDSIDETSKDGTYIMEFGLDTGMYETIAVPRYS
jgi:hypothetical protein